MIDFNLIMQSINQVRLDLNGLSVYTEVASGPYLASPILAALANARKVFAQVNNSKYGEASKIIAQARKLALACGVGNKIEFVIGRSYNGLGQADVVTNSGHVRPIDRDLIDTLKPTAVIPLMWETWEFRAQDFDLEYCKKRGILVLGTNEQRPPCDMRRYIALASLKQLLNFGYDGGKVLLLGNSPFPGKVIFEYLSLIGIKIVWVSDDVNASLGYEKLAEHFSNYGSDYSHLIVAEHKNPRLLLGANGLLTGRLIKHVNPLLRITLMCGNVDATDLRLHELDFSPDSVAPFGFLSFQPHELGPRPVITLYSAGLKVGEQMSKARLRGKSPSEAARSVLQEGLAVDFHGDLAWTRN